MSDLLEYPAVLRLKTHLANRPSVAMWSHEKSQWYFDGNFYNDGAVADHAAEIALRRWADSFHSIYDALVFEIRDLSQQVTLAPGERVMRVRSGKDRRVSDPDIPAPSETMYCRTGPSDRRQRTGLPLPLGGFDTLPYHCPGCGKVSCLPPDSQARCEACQAALVGIDNFIQLFREAYTRDKERERYALEDAHLVCEMRKKIHLLESRRRFVERKPRRNNNFGYSIQVGEKFIEQPDHRGTKQDRRGERD